MKKNKLLVIAICIAVLVGIAGCAPNDTGLNNTNNRLTTQTRVNRNTNWDLNRNYNNNDNLGANDYLNNGFDTGGNLNNGMSRDRRLNTMTTSLGNLNNTANDLARRIGALPEVDRASVVLTDDTCLVGLDLRGTNDGANNNNISTALRQRIERIVRDTTNVNVEDISITADPDLTTRIQGISTNMTNSVGNDVRDFTTDIEDIIRRIIPGTRTRNTNTMTR